MTAPGESGENTPETIGAPASGGHVDKSGRATLTRELSDFLIELSIALHKHSMYPPGHPSLGPTANGVATRLGSLLENRSSLSLGVARHQLVIEGVATDSNNPVLTDLANRLHAHEIGAVTFDTGVVAGDVLEFLTAVALDPTRVTAPLGRAGPGGGLTSTHVHVYPVAYDRLHLASDDLDESEAEATREARTRAAQLWVGLARAALSMDELAPDDDSDEMDAEPSLVANAISSNERGSAYDQVIVGYLLQIADEIRGSGGSEALALKNRMTKLVSHLSGSTLQQLLKMGGESGQRRRFLVDAAQGISAEAVIKLASAAAESEQQTVSNSMLRILGKLAHHAETGPAPRRRAAMDSIKDQVTELVQGWSLTDPNPDEYTLALQKMAKANPLFKVASERFHKPEPKRIVQMALEVNVAGPAVDEAIQELIDSRDTGWLVDITGESDADMAIDRIWKNVATVDRLNAVLREDPLDVDALDAILPRLRDEAAEAMIDALVEAESRQTRRILLDRVNELGPRVAPLCVARLADSRWYVQRNMLAIIGRLPGLPEGFRVGDFFEHPDERVRREALRIMFDHEQLRERAVCRAISDTDPRTVRLGLAAAMTDCPKAAVSLVVSKATSGTDEDQRTAAIRVLGVIDDPVAVDVLLKIAGKRRSLFGSKLPHKSPEYLEALRALSGRGGNPRVAAVLTAASLSKDPEVARAARGSRGTS